MRFDFLWEEFGAFGKCLKLYAQKRGRQAATRFETGKGYLVDFLISRRGVHARSFLNFSIAILVVSGMITAPVIASSYPGMGNDLSTFTPPSAVAGALTTSVDQTSTIVSDKPRDQVITYKVQKGDTLGKIADQFGVSVDTIRWANDLTDDSLAIGDILSIPPVTGIVYKVKAGDTIYSIAKQYKTDAQKIVNFPFNDFTDLDTFALSVGQSLVVPDGVVPEAAPVIAPSVPPSQIAGGNGEFVWPLGGVITQYPVWYHMALDIATAQGTGIAAAGEGTVSVPPFMAYGYGNYVEIDHGNGLVTLYGHMSQVYVSSGQHVSRGQIIGAVGSTGRSTGPHCHFEVRKNGVTVNPLSYLQ